MSKDVASKAWYCKIAAEKDLTCGECGYCNWAEELMYNEGDEDD